MRISRRSITRALERAFEKALERVIGDKAEVFFKDALDIDSLERKLAEKITEGLACFMRNGIREKTKVGRCFECGKRALKTTQSDCELLDGTVIRDLTRLHCSRCGSDFFDGPTMKEIRRQRTEQKLHKNWRK